MGKVLDDVSRRQGSDAAKALDEAVRDPDQARAGEAARSAYTGYLTRPLPALL